MATSHPTSLQLTWFAPALPNGIITAYEVSHQLQGGMELGRENTTDARTTHTLTGLRPETTYTVTVKAYTIVGSGQEERLTVTTATVRKFLPFFVINDLTHLSACNRITNCGFPDVSPGLSHY